MKVFCKKWFSWTGLLLLLFCGHLCASTKSELQALVPQVQSIAAQNEIISAVAAANQSHATLGSKEIRVLGREWHQGLVGQNSAVLSEVNNSNLSATLKSIQDKSNGQYVGIVVTDAKGLVIGQTYNAPHYSQAHGSIWDKIAKKGVEAVYYSKPKKTSTGNVASLGLPIIEAGKVIGAILVEIPVTAESHQAKKHSDKAA